MTRPGGPSPGEGVTPASVTAVAIVALVLHVSLGRHSAHASDSRQIRTFPPGGY